MNTHGYSRCQFGYDDNDQKVFRFEFIDGVEKTITQTYLDQQKYYFEFNLTQIDFGNLTNNTLVFNNTGKSSVVTMSASRLKYFTLEDHKETIEATMNITFYNKTSGGYFNLNSDVFDVD